MGDSSVQRVSRSDVSRLGKLPRTGAGAVRIPATISRTGVQAYPEQGLREYRPDSEVFAPESLASLASVPVTLNHPPAGVTPANAREYQIGHVTDAPPEARVKVDGNAEEWLRTTLIVSDGDALVKIDAGGAAEVSCGYSCELEMTPGVAPDGTRYDAIQRKIRFNHVAILTTDHKARAGADAKLRLDNKSENTEKTMKILVIDGAEYEFGSEKHIAKLQSDSERAVAAEKSRADKAEAERDAAKDALKAAQALTSDAALDARVLARHNLLKAASKFLPAKYDTAGKSDHQIRVDALTAAKIDCAGKSEDYVSARFDGLCDPNQPAQWSAAPKADSASPSAPKTDSDDDFRAELAKKESK